MPRGIRKHIDIDNPKPKAKKVPRKAGKEPAPKLPGKRTKRTVKVGVDQLLKYQLATKLTWKEVATKFGVGTSTLHKYVAQKQMPMYLEVLVQAELTRLALESLEKKVSLMAQVPEHKLKNLAKYLKSEGIKYVTHPQ